MTVDTMRERFRALHAEGTFVMPNPWDIGSAKILASIGFPALATTSSGHAASLGRLDQRVTRDELVAHVAAMASAVDVPLNVDAEYGFADDAPGLDQTIELLGTAGAAGVSIEDYEPRSGTIMPMDAAVARIRAAAEAARRHGLVLTARAENHLYGAGDLDDTIARLVAYRDAGAEVLYAPGLHDAGDIARVVRAVGAPVNVLALRSGPPVPELSQLGVRRVSTGGGLARAAYGALVTGARELATSGTSSYLDSAVTGDVVEAAFSAET